jgi:hypothetical protein
MAHRSGLAEVDAMAAEVWGHGACRSRKRERSPLLDAQLRLRRVGDTDGGQRSVSDAAADGDGMAADQLGRFAHLQ